MKSFKLLFTALFILVLGCQRDTNNLISYTISPITSEGKSMLKINMSSLADTDGETAFLFLIIVFLQSLDLLFSG